MKSQGSIRELSIMSWFEIQVCYSEEFKEQLNWGYTYRLKRECFLPILDRYEIENFLTLNSLRPLLPLFLEGKEELETKFPKGVRVMFSIRKSMILIL